MTKQCALPFVGDAIELPLGEVFLDSTSGSENIATLALLVTELAVSNIFLVNRMTGAFVRSNTSDPQVYRLWIVWGHNWSVAALPSCVLVFSIGTGLYCTNTKRWHNLPHIRSRRKHVCQQYATCQHVNECLWLEWRRWRSSSKHHLKTHTSVSTVVYSWFE